MKKEKVREILDKFENDDFVDAKELLQTEIRTTINDKIMTATGVDLNEKLKIGKNPSKTAKRALGTLDAIMDATRGSDSKSSKEIYKMANDIGDWYNKNGGFSSDQAKWIWKTSVAMFKK